MRLLTNKELIKRSKIKRITLHRWEKRGYVKPVIVDGRKRYPISWVRAVNMLKSVHKEKGRVYLEVKDDDSKS